MMRPSHLVVAAALLASACTGDAPMFTEHRPLFYPDRVPLAVRVGDLDADGDADAVVVNATGPEVSLHWNSGNGLVKAMNVDLSTDESVHDVHVTELSGASPPDLAVLLDRGVAVLTNKGRGQFEVEAGGRVAPAQGCTALVPGDFTGDGVTDLYVFGAEVSDLFPGPDYLTRQDPAPPFLEAPPQPVLADLDGDAAADLLGLRDDGQGGRELVGLLGGGDGTFVDVAVPMPDPPVEVRVLTAADLDGDGRDDVLAAGAGWFGTWLRTDDGFAGLQRHRMEGLDPLSIHAFDANGDGRNDVVLGAADGTVHVFAGGNRLTFLVADALSPGPNPTSLAHGDLNGDGYQDLVVVAEGTCCPVQDAALHVYLGGPLDPDHVSIDLE